MIKCLFKRTKFSAVIEKTNTVFSFTGQMCIDTLLWPYSYSGYVVLNRRQPWSQKGTATMEAMYKAGLKAEAGSSGLGADLGLAIFQWGSLLVQIYAFDFDKTLGKLLSLLWFS